MLFKQIVKDEKLDKNFKSLRDEYGHYPAREFMKRVYKHYIDTDGNFIEQFQSTGFDARLFELYFFGYLYQEGYKVDQSFDRPDFMVSDDNQRVAIELTTVNFSKRIDDLRKENMPVGLESLHDELAIRFGSSLYSKLQKKYWELDHCKNIPLVIAVEAFFEEGSLHYSSTALVNYLYGIKNEHYYDKNGNLIVNQNINETHKLGNKEIPSGFFNQKDSEYISAVIFTNSATLAKFKRVGYILGHNNGDIYIERSGECYNDDPNAIKPNTFKYEVGNPLYDELMADGLTVCINPNAKNPLNKNFFVNASRNEVIDDEVAFFAPDFSVYRSFTKAIVFEKLKGKFKRIDVNTLGEYFNEHKVHPKYFESEAYLSLDDSKLGIVLFDGYEENFLALFFTRGKNGKYDFVGNGENKTLSINVKEDILEFFENPHFNFA